MDLLIFRQINKENTITTNILFKNMKKFTHRFGSIFGSVSFGIFLFGMQSYFLRQNLGLTGKMFISD